MQVKVKRRGSDVKYMARVLSVGTECDIGEPCGPMAPWPCQHVRPRLQCGLSLRATMTNSNSMLPRAARQAEAEAELFWFVCLPVGAASLPCTCANHARAGYRVCAMP